MKLDMMCSFLCVGYFFLFFIFNENENIKPSSKIHGLLFSWYFFPYFLVHFQNVSWLTFNLLLMTHPTHRHHPLHHYPHYPRYLHYHPRRRSDSVVMNGELEQLQKKKN